MVWSLVLEIRIRDKARVPERMRIVRSPVPEAAKWRDVSVGDEEMPNNVIFHLTAQLPLLPANWWSSIRTPSKHEIPVAPRGSKEPNVT